MKVPFDPQPDVVFSWLRTEKPGPKRLDKLIEAQAPGERAQLRRLLRDAAEAIVADTDPGGLSELATLDARNHAAHLLDDGVLTKVDPVVVDPDADVRAALAEALAVVDNQQALLLEQEQIVSRLEQRITELEEGVNRALDQVDVVEVAPAPTAEEQAIARSAAILDEDPADWEVKPWNASLPVVAAEEDDFDELFGGEV